MTEEEQKTINIIKQAVAEELKNGKVATLSDVAVAKDDFAAKMEKWMTTKPEPKAAELNEAGTKGMFNSITNMEVWGIPVGQAAAGGFIAVLATELVDGFMSTKSVQMRGAVKLIAAGAIVKFGGKYIGSTAGKAVALLMAFDALRDLTPIDSWASSLATKVTKVNTTAGLADKSNRRSDTSAGIPSSIVRSFEGRAG